MLSHPKSGTEAADTSELMTGILRFVAEVRVQDLAKEISTRPIGERMGKAARALTQVGKVGVSSDSGFEIFSCRSDSSFDMSVGLASRFVYASSRPNSTTTVAQGCTSE